MFPRKDIIQVGNVHEGAILIIYKNELGQGKFKLLDVNNNLIAKEFDGLTNINKGVIFYAINDGNSLKWGIMDKKGVKITNPQFDNVISNINNFYGVSIIDEKGKEKWGFIDNKGKYIIEPFYDSVGNYDGMVALEEESNLLWGIINSNGEYIFDCKYEAIYRLE